MKTKHIKSLVIGYSLSFAFVGLGFLILNASEMLLAQIIGYSNIILFSGLILWSIFKLIKTLRKSSKF